MAPDGDAVERERAVLVHARVAAFGPMSSDGSVDGREMRTCVRSGGAVEPRLEHDRPAMRAAPATSDDVDLDVAADDGSGCDANARHRRDRRRARAACSAPAARSR